MIYIILGMHKSGTSMISEILHKSGISMGKQFKEGSRLQYEDINGVRINKRALMNSNMTWDGFGDFKPDYKYIKRLQKYLTSRSDEGLYWGFKDPRTIITWPMWEKALDPFKYEIISVYRNPMSTAKHWHKPRKVPYYLDVWNNYNEKLIEILKNTKKRHIILNYDELLKTKNIDIMSVFLQTELINIIDENKQSNKNEEIPKKCQKTWEELKKIKGQF